MKAEDFDKKFDQGKEDISNDLDLSSATRPNQTPRRVIEICELPERLI